MEREMKLSKIQVNKLGSLWQVEFYRGSEVIGGSICGTWKQAMIRALLGWDDSKSRSMPIREWKQRFLGLTED